MYCNTKFVRNAGFTRTGAASRALIVALGMQKLYRNGFCCPDMSRALIVALGMQKLYRNTFSCSDMSHALIVALGMQKLYRNGFCCPDMSHALIVALGMQKLYRNAFAYPSKKACCMCCRPTVLRSRSQAAGSEAPRTSIHAVPGCVLVCAARHQLTCTSSTSTTDPL
jgi:hypothetical protein